MDMAPALVRKAIRKLDPPAVAAGFHAPVRELLKLRRQVVADSLAAALEPPTGVDPAGTAEHDGWNLPDAVWLALLRQRRGLGDYPLGECCERAVKATVAGLLLDAGDGVSLDLRSRDADAALGRALVAIDERRLARMLLGRLMFEVAVGRLRRPGRLGHGYDFTRAERAVSTAAETRLRDALEGQCAAAAKDWLKEVAGKGKEPLILDDRALPGACRSLFETGLRPSRQCRGNRWVNVVDGPWAKRPGRVQQEYQLAPRPLRLLVHDPRYNFSFRFKPFEDHLGRRLRSLTRDLLDLGVAVYASDLYTRRGSCHLDRSTGLLLSVRHPDRWRDGSDCIRRAIGVLGREGFDVHFEKLKEKTSAEPFKVADDRRCVCLFSGGLDSLAGAAWALDEGLDPIFVSHHAQNQLAGIQTRLLEALSHSYGRKGLAHVSFHAAKKAVRKKKPARDRRHRPLWPLGGQCQSVMAQYLRSFLFLSAAAALALEKGIERVYLFENGPVALNPSISEGRVNTRTAHPHVLDAFAELIRRVFGVRLVIENPFRYQTKGEVLRHLDQPGLRQCIAESNSCWNWFNVALRAGREGLEWHGERQDGDCLPCLVRRAAIIAAELEDDDDAPYLVDVFSDYPAVTERTRLAVADLLRFCCTVLALDDAELLRRVPELSVYEPATDCRQLAEMIRRHAREVRDGFRSRANPAFRWDFASLL